MQIYPSSRQIKPENKALWTAAQQLEGQFVAEMLKAAGFGKPSDFFKSAGEDHFQSFLIDAQSEALTQTTSFGLSEHIFRALMERAK